MKTFLQMLLSWFMPLCIVDVSALVLRLEATVADMGDLLGKSKTETDAAKKADYLAAYRAKTEQFNSLKADLDEAKAMNEAEASVIAAKALLTPDTKGKTLNPDNQPGDDAKGKADVIPNAEKEEHAKVVAFDKFVLGGKSMTSEERNMLLPGDRFKSVDGLSAGDCAIMPKSIARNIIGGKVMLSTDATLGVDSNASKLLAPDWRNQVIQTPQAVPMIYDLCQPIMAANGKATWPILLDEGAGGTRNGGVAFTYKATEGADKGETEPKFGDFEILTHELSGWTELSGTNLRRSAIDLEGFLTGLFRNAAHYQWSRDVLRGLGDASNQPNGILTSTGVVNVPRAQAGCVVWPDLTNLQYGITRAHRLGARYIMDDSVEKYLHESVDTVGRPLFTPDTMNGVNTKMAGYNYETHEFEPVLGTEGDIIFGNMMNYWFAIEEDIAIARSDHAAFKSGRVVFRLICFVGGKPVRGSAFSMLGDAV